MIEIFQKNIPENILCNNYTKMDVVELHINNDILNKDISKLNELSKNPKNKYDLHNIKELIKYFNKLSKNINEESKLEICWTVKDGLPSSYPLSLINEPLYNVNICNYIELNVNEHIVEVDTSDLAEILSFEMMYRDLDETHETIEELLKDCGIIGLESSSLLIDYFKEKGEHIHQLSKKMKIGDTPYRSSEKDTVYDYFSSRKFKTDKYRDVIKHSCLMANTIIVNNYIKNAQHNNIEIQLISITENNIVFMVKDVDEQTIKEKILDDISVRSFGRGFSINPNIRIF